MNADILPTEVLPPADTVSLRERKKDATRRALAERALALALDHGFSGFTIAELVADVGVSRRTFSNYFASKAEAVAAVTDGWLDDVLEAIRAAPADTGLLDILRTGLTTVAHGGVDRWGALQILSEAEPELQAQILASNEAIADAVGAEIARCTDLPADDIRVKLFAAFAVTAGREVLTRWVARGDAATNEELGDLLEAAFSIINPEALGDPEPGRPTGRPGAGR